jgi:uncharacterized protein
MDAARSAHHGGQDGHTHGGPADQGIPADQDGPADQGGQGPGQATHLQRDRDAVGRPRNARPRDASGRPLQRGQAGEAGVPDELSLTPEAAVAEAQRLIDSGRPFHAHEILEASWKADPGAERDLWQGLAQLAVGLTHAQRGNAHGAVALLRRGADRVRPFSAAAPHGVDVAGAVKDAHRLARQIEDDGLGGVSAADLRLSLLSR